MTKLLLPLVIALALPACGKKNSAPPASAGDMQKTEPAAAPGDPPGDPKAEPADPCAATEDPCASPAEPAKTP